MKENPFSLQTTDVGLTKSHWLDTVKTGCLQSSATLKLSSPEADLYLCYWFLIRAASPAPAGHPPGWTAGPGSLRYLHAWHQWDCLRETTCYCRPLKPLYKAPLVSISPFETLLQNLTPVVENLISRLSLLIANLYHFVLVPALIFITKDFSSPLVFTWQWRVLQRENPLLPRLCFIGKLLSFGFLSFARLSDPYSSSQPLLHLPIFQAEPHTEFLAHPCTLFKLPVCSRAVSLKPSYSHVSSDFSPPYLPSKPGAFLAQAVVTEVSIRPSNLRPVLVRSSELSPGLCKF